MPERRTSPRWFALSAAMSLVLSLMLYLQIHMLWFGPRTVGQLFGSVFTAFCALALSFAALVASLKMAQKHRAIWRVVCGVLLLGSSTMLGVGCMQSVFIT